ncbi:hypothetical protein PIROE2DRAFT_7903 [Piromyces sp. E2]|nr:hypothetical protein PIROE2DRAFT_7903 [Piromyces sp. E2]|eukprot:OUM65177.1 hypothetical protein PIROE2DRAFT_7903 [Piromyces sp. E2]
MKIKYIEISTNVIDISVYDIENSQNTISEIFLIKDINSNIEEKKPLIYHVKRVIR